MLHKEDHTASVRTSVVLNNEILDSYFRELKCIVDDHKLLDKPENICNADETGMPLDQAPSILAKKRQKKVQFR